MKCSITFSPFQVSLFLDPLTSPNYVHTPLYIDKAVIKTEELSKRVLLSLYNLTLLQILVYMITDLKSCVFSFTADGPKDPIYLQAVQERYMCAYTCA